MRLIDYSGCDGRTELTELTGLTYRAAQTKINKHLPSPNPGQPAQKNRRPEVKDKGLSLCNPIFRKHPDPGVEYCNFSLILG